MLTFISNLQRKPEGLRKKIAFTASAGLTGVIVIFWLISILSQDSGPTVASTKEEVGPFQALTEGIGVLFEDTTDTLKGAVGAFTGLKEEVSVPAGEEVAPPAPRD